MEIKFINVGFKYNINTPLEKEILNDINMTIQEGKINAIVGKSGSGKTTLVQMINSLTVPTSGTIKVGNVEINNNSKIVNIDQLRFKIGIVFEFPEDQFFNKTVYNEIAFGLKTFKYKTEQINKRVSDSLKMVGLDDSYLKRDPFTLSNGEKRKVAIASILIFNPEVIIFDEPTVGLDSNSKNNMMRLMNMLKNKYNKTIIIISQDVDFLHRFVDYVFILGDKQIVLHGDKYTVFKDEVILKKYGIEPPKIMEFTNLILNKKGIKMGYRDEVNDLIKDIYRHVK